MTTEPEMDDALEQAARRLERATALLEQRVGHLTGAAEGGGLFDMDRAKLAAELDAARARERELAEAGEQASQALGRAIAEIEGALADSRQRGAA